MSRAVAPSVSDQTAPLPPVALALAVIGHVNHGKTALVRALTGMETDRLQEEIARGLSITLGFAWRDLPSGPVDFIDAPGHEDYIRAMVGGTAGARAALLVVSATEGFQRQTREHLQIAALLGLRHGVVAVTKADLLEPGDEIAAIARIAHELSGTALEGQPIVLCSATSGRGLEDLLRCLEDLAGRCPPPVQLPGAFLPIDRAFTVTGTGTVVTGTLQGAGLEAGSDAVLWPSGRRVGLRQIQVHGQETRRAEPGGRVAVSLRGLNSAEVRSGEVLCAPDAFQPSLQVDVDLTLSAASPRPLRHMDEVRVLWGARQDMATVRLIGERTVQPGDRILAQLRFSSPVIAFAGQQAVLRRPSPAQTLGGVVVLDPQATPFQGKAAERRKWLEAAADGDLAQIAAALVQRDGSLAITDVARLSRRTIQEVGEALRAEFESLDSSHLVLKSAIAQARQAYLERLAKAHSLAPLRFTAPTSAIRDALSQITSRTLMAHIERQLADEGAIRLEGSHVALPGHDPFALLTSAAAERLEQMETVLRDGGLMPVDLGTLTGGDPEGEDLLGLLVGSGRAVSLRNHALKQTLAFHREAIDAAAEQLILAFPAQTAFTTGEARAALSTTRKYIVPLLEHLDGLGLTVRQGDVRQVVRPTPSAR